MTQLQLTTLIAIIHERRTVFDIAESDSDSQVAIRISDRLLHTQRKAVSIVALERYRRYPAGHEWIIPCEDIDRAAKSLCRESHELWERWRTSQMTIADVERIISRATYGIIRLNLSHAEDAVAANGK